MIKQKFISATLITFLFGSTLMVLPAYAANGANNGGNFFSGLVQFLSQRLGIDQGNVQSAVNDYRTQHKQTVLNNLQNREKTRLDKLVKQGKITADQETAILKELSDLRAKYNLDNLPNETSDQRKQVMQNFRNDLKTWAQQNNINLQYIMPFGGMMRGGMHGMKNGWGKPSPTQ